MHTQLVALVAAFDARGRVLLLKRPEGAAQAGLWSFPGGKVEPGENPLHAATRELREETGLAGRRWRFLGRTSHVAGDTRLHFMLFCCRVFPEGEPVCESPHAWAMPEEFADAARWPMPPANTAMLGWFALPELRAWLAETDQHRGQNSVSCRCQTALSRRFDPVPDTDRSGRR